MYSPCASRRGNANVFFRRPGLESTAFAQQPRPVVVGPGVRRDDGVFAVASPLALAMTVSEPSLHFHGGTRWRGM